MVMRVHVQESIADKSPENGPQSSTVAQSNVVHCVSSFVLRVSSSAPRPPARQVPSIDEIATSRVSGLSESVPDAWLSLNNFRSQLATQ